ncbi:MAG: AarF/ABC1/UbiB kinase family protein [Gloeomargarita sp. DG_1_5_bins_55]
MLSGFARTTERQGEIAEILLRNGWKFMRQLLLGKKVGEPELPPPAVLRQILVDLGPVYVKLGQLLSTRADILPASYTQALSALQSKVPPVDWSEMEVEIRRELPQPMGTVFAHVNPQPVAAGSIGQTYRATLTDGTEVALKVQRPGIGAVIDQDLTLLRSLAALAEQTEWGQSLNWVALVDEFSAVLIRELDFSQEAQFTRTIGTNLARSPWPEVRELRVPRVYDELSTSRLLVLEWLDGLPLLAGYRTTEQSQGAGIARMILRAFFQQICLDGLFHADPHPGNFFYLKSGQVALLDFGNVASFDPRTQGLITELLLALVMLEPRRCVQLTLELSESPRPDDLNQLEQDFSRLLRRYYPRSLGQVNFGQLLGEILETARQNRVRLPGSMGILARTLAYLEGIGRELDPQFDLVGEMRPLMGQLLQRQFLGTDGMAALWQTALDLRSLSLDSPRQVDLLLQRLNSENLRWQVNITDIELLQRAVDTAANRLSYSVVVGAFIIGAAIIFDRGQANIQLFLGAGSLLVGAMTLGFWLLFRILRPNRLG